MIPIFQQGDILKSNSDLIINPTNSVGVMGKGLALDFFRKHEHICKLFNEYSKFMNEDRKVLLNPMIYKVENFNYKFICCFPTKIDWKNKSQYKFIENNLKILHHKIDIMNENNSQMIEGVAFPKIGCGLGGLDENEVLRIIKKEFQNSELKIEFWNFDA